MIDDSDEAIQLPRKGETGWFFHRDGLLYGPFLTKVEAEHEIDDFG